MRIGTLGSGLMGGKLGTLFTRAGHDVVFRYARSRQKIEQLARHPGSQARAGTPGDAVRDADVVLLAVHWLRLDDVLQQAGGVSGKVVVTCSLPMNATDTGLVVGHTNSGAEELAKRIPQARVVSAFGTVPSDVFFRVFDARNAAPEPRVLRRRRCRKGSCGDADSRCWLRPGRRGFTANCSLPRAVRSPHGTIRV